LHSGEKARHKAGFFSSIAYERPLADRAPDSPADEWPFAGVVVAGHIVLKTYEDIFSATIVASLAGSVMHEACVSDLKDSDGCTILHTKGVTPMNHSISKHEPQ
jgi:hypothetical protein